jgi:hypothetical protein
MFYGFFAFMEKIMKQYLAPILIPLPPGLKSCSDDNCVDRVKSISQFYRSETSCVDCCNRRRSEARKKFKLILYQYLLENPCVDCGETDIFVLEFDHTGTNKTMNVGSMCGHSKSRIMKEIQKCEVRCHRCHKMKTLDRLGTLDETLDLIQLAKNSFDYSSI